MSACRETWRDPDTEQECRCERERGHAPPCECRCIAVSWFVRDYQDLRISALGR